MIGALGALGGCLQAVQDVVQPIEEPIGQTRLMSTYHVGRLTTELPPEVRVESIISASRSVLEERGYTIRRTETTADLGMVVGRPPEGDRTVTIRALVLVDATRLSVRFEPWGARGASVAILEDVLTSLGY